MSSPLGFGVTPVEFLRPGADLPVDLEIEWSLAAPSGDGRHSPVEPAELEVLAIRLSKDGRTRDCPDDLRDAFLEDEAAIDRLREIAEDTLRERREMMMDDLAHAAMDL